MSMEQLQDISVSEMRMLVTAAISFSTSEMVKAVCAVEKLKIALVPVLQTKAALELNPNSSQVRSLQASSSELPMMPRLQAFGQSNQVIPNSPQLRRQDVRITSWNEINSAGRTKATSHSGFIEPALKQHRMEIAAPTKLPAHSPPVLTSNQKTVFKSVSQSPVEHIMRGLCKTPSGNSGNASSSRLSERSGEQTTVTSSSSTLCGLNTFNSPTSKTASDKSSYTFDCSLCKYTSKSKSLLTRHHKRNHGVKPHKCSYCPYSFADKQDLSRHLSTHTGYKPYRCRKCGLAFVRQDFMMKHYRRCTGYLQSGLQKKQSTSASLHLVNQKNHTQTVQTSSAQGDEIRERLHEGIDQHKKKEVDNHSTAASTEEDNGSQDFTNLLNDSRLSGDYAYKCAVCPYEGHSPAELLFHHSKVHNSEDNTSVTTKTQERDVVDQSTDATNSVASFAASRTDRFEAEQHRTAYECNICSYKANNSIHLQLHHSKEHSNKLQYKCTYCSYSNCNNIEFNSHVQSHYTRQGFFKCSKCTFITLRKDSLSEHMLEKHNQSPDDSIPVSVMSVDVSPSDKDDLTDLPFTHEGNQTNLDNCVESESPPPTDIFLTDFINGADFLTSNNDERTTPNTFT